MGQSYLKNAALLTGADVLLRLAGMGLRIYLANALGGEGMGLYQLVLAVYALFVTLATAGVSVAATRLDDRKETKSKIIILVTDGASNSGQISPLVAAENAAKLGIKIYTIAVGTEEGTLANGMVVQSEFDEPTLRKIAQLTGGEHFRATNMASFNKAFTSIGKLEKSEAKVQTVRHIEEYFMYFLVTGAALALLGLSLQVLKPAPAP